MKQPVSSDSTESPTYGTTFAFPFPWQEGVQQAIYRRRDVRRFRPDPVPPVTLARMLQAAYHAPSVGFMPPWNFIVVTGRSLTRSTMKARGTAHPEWPAPDQLLQSAIPGKGASVNRISDVTRRIGGLDLATMRSARERQDQLTKPPGSLGRLEELSVKLAGITGRARPRFPRKAVLVLAADHGVTAAGVSAYPQAVTAQMVLNFLAGGAAINVLARRAGARVVVADLGVASDLPEHPNLVQKKIGYGTRNMVEGPAMTVDEALAAVAAGIDLVEAELARGLDLVATGDMGIGNTTASSAIIATITGAPIADVTGRGTGVDDRGWARKVETIERACALNRPDPADPIDVLAKVGGFEIGGLVGVILGAAAARVPVIVDGFISGAAALLATELCPTARDYLIAAHNSVEIGHRVVLERLELVPLLNLNLRLGEGTGAAMAMHLIDDAVAILDEMATFDEAGVSGKSAAAGNETPAAPELVS